MVAQRTINRCRIIYPKGYQLGIMHYVSTALRLFMCFAWASRSSYSRCKSDVTVVSKTMASMPHPTSCKGVCVLIQPFDVLRLCDCCADACFTTGLSAVCISSLSTKFSASNMSPSERLHSATSSNVMRATCLCTSRADWPPSLDTRAFMSGFTVYVNHCCQSCMYCTLLTLHSVRKYQFA